MATPADQRLLELLDKWLGSLELHLKYSALDADAYSKIQPWPEHQRPNRWIIDLAKQKALVLRGQVQDRIATGDVKFSESLELMTFLANLVGAEHIERFIPLASPDSERAPGRESPDGAAQAASASAASAAPPPVADTTGTREMPRFPEAGPRVPAPSGSAAIARTERGGGHERPASEHGIVPDAMLEQVIADAARLVQWGRKWYELAELISGMADRPSLIEVRRILIDNKSVIDKKAGRG